MDDPNNRHQPDRSRINLSQDYEVRYWSEKFGISEGELRQVVARVGNSPDAVEQALKNKAPTE